MAVGQLTTLALSVNIQEMYEKDKVPIIKNAQSKEALKDFNLW